MSNPPMDPPEIARLVQRLEQLEARMVDLEARLGAGATGETTAEQLASKHDPPPTTSHEGVVERRESFEMEMGRNWFAKAGVVVLVLGLAFMLSLPYPDTPSAIPSLAGYVVVAGLVFGTRRLRTAHPEIARYGLGGALLLLYLSTFRLSFFGAEKTLTNRWMLGALLLGVVGLQLTVAVRRRSQALAWIPLVLGCLTALVVQSPPLVFAILLLVALAVLALARRYSWDALLVGAVVIVPSAHALWAMGNPLTGGPVRVVDGPAYNLLFLLLDSAVFAAAGVISRGGTKEKPLEILAAFLNAAGTYLLVLFLTLTSFKPGLLAWNMVAAGFFLAFAVAHWVVRRSQWVTFAYAMTGYTALSAAVLGGVSLPTAWVWLCWESLLVVSTAVWFRSRFIVVANFAIFLFLFAAYLLSARPIGPASLGFGVVALATARVLNWHKDRLELKTEAMRNAYLATALFMIPFALFHTVPRGLVSISWLGLAALYYLASRLLGNPKYRWMALLTIALTALWVFAVDLVALSPVLRVVSFLVLGAALLAISLTYGRRRTTPLDASSEDRARPDSKGP